MSDILNRIATVKGVQRLLRRYAPRKDESGVGQGSEGSPSIERAGGFSLIELLVVVVVVGILAAVAMNSMSSGIDDLRRVQTEREMDRLADAIVGDPAVTAGGRRADFGYVGDVGAFPPSLTALVQNPGYATWHGPYLAPGFVQDTVGYRLDAWGKPYAYNGGIAISSTGGGSTITKKVADASSDYLANTYRAEIRDALDSLPGPIYADSVTVSISFPNGVGGMGATAVHPDSMGEFTISGLPVGVHPVRLVYEPMADTLTRYLTILPRHRSNPPDIYRFASGYFAGGGAAGCSGSGVDTLRPVGNGTLNDCGVSGCAATWQCVDDVPDDDDGTYVESNGTGWTTDLYETANPVDTGCTIDRVTVIVSARRFVKDAYVKTQLRTNGMTFDGTEQVLGDAYQAFDTVYDLNPSTGTAWTWSDIFSLEIGVALRSTRSTHPARCTAVWITIEYSN